MPDEELHQAIVSIAHRAPSLAAFRAETLTKLRKYVPFDVAVFHALSPRVPLETGAFVGIDLAAVSSTKGAWDDWAVELGALRHAADERVVVTDEDVYPSGSRGRARFEKSVLRAFGGASLCLVHLHLRESLRAAIVLLSKRPRAFGRSRIETLLGVVPVLALADALHERLDGAPRATMPSRLRCKDERLTQVERTLMEHVALGHSNDQIAKALEKSPNTVRNQLARVFARIGASNRADAVRLAVLVPDSRASKR